MADEKKVLEQALKTEKTALYSVFVVDCPMVGCLTPEANCFACGYRRAKVQCPEMKKLVPEEYCEMCFDRTQAAGTYPVCRYQKWRIGRIKKDKLQTIGACAYPRRLRIGRLSVPAGQVIQQAASCVIKPATAPEPWSLTPALQMNPVTRAAELVGVHPGILGWLRGIIRRWLGLEEE